MTGRRTVLMLLTVLLVSGVGLGGWSTPVPGLAQDTQDAADVVIYQEPPGDVADVSVFYEPLAPYGTWISLPEYGQVWIPHDVAPGWRPYTTGRWVYTDYGWTWVSDQEWGWAPFHYGRWAFVASYGWVWIPGTAWAPAWVVWRHAPGWVGWAPLPPQVVVRPGIEIRAANIDAHIAPSWFCFVEERRILAHHVSTYIAPPARNVSLVQITQNVTHYTVIQNRVVNRGVPVERIERVTARPVPRMRVVETQAPEAMHGAQVRERAREVVLFRPATPPGARAQAPQSPPPPQLAPGTTLPQQHEDTYHRLRERQIRERAALEEQQRQAPQSGLQSLSPEQLRVQRETERRALEDKARRDRQEQQQVQQQLQQRQEQERQRTLQQQQQQQALERQRALQQHQQPQVQQPQILERQRAVLQQQQEQERQRALQQQQQPQALERQRTVLQQQQQQALERQRALQQQPQVQQPQALERQRALQQQHNYQPSPPQGVLPQASQQPRAATQRAPEEGKEQRKRQPQPAPGQQPSQQ